MILMKLFNNVIEYIRRNQYRLQFIRVIIKYFHRQTLVLVCDFKDLKISIKCLIYFWHVLRSFFVHSRVL